MEHQPHPGTTRPSWAPVPEHVEPTEAERSAHNEATLARLRAQRDAATTWWCVVYRIGGYARFQWRHALPLRDKRDAQEQLENVLRQGYVAHIAPYDVTVQNALHGVPTTFEPGDDVDAVEVSATGWSSQTDRLSARERAALPAQHSADERTRDSVARLFAGTGE